MARTDLRFGDVIRFRFCGGEVTAMVLATHVSAAVVTDEGTAVYPDGDSAKVLIFGLANDGDPEDYQMYHNVGKTATFILGGPNDYEVLWWA